MDEGKKQSREPKRPVVTPEQLANFESKKTAFKQALEKKRRSELFDKFFKGTISDKELASIKKEVENFLNNNPLKPADVNVNRLIIAAKLTDQAAKSAFFAGKLSWNEVTAKLAGKETKPKPAKPDQRRFKNIPAIVQDAVPAGEFEATPVEPGPAAEPPAAPIVEAPPAQPAPSTEPAKKPVPDLTPEQRRAEIELAAANAVGGQGIIDWIKNENTIKRIEALDNDPKNLVEARALTGELLALAYASPDVLGKYKNFRPNNAESVIFSILIKGLKISDDKFRKILPNAKQWDLTYSLYRTIRQDVPPEERKKQPKISFQPTIANSATKKLFDIYTSLVAGAVTPEVAHKEISVLFKDHADDIPELAKKSIDELLKQATAIYPEPEPEPLPPRPEPSFKNKKGEFSLTEFAAVAKALEPTPPPPPPVPRAPLPPIVPPRQIKLVDTPQVTFVDNTSAPKAPAAEKTPPITAPPEPAPQIPEATKLPQTDSKELVLSELGLPPEKLKILEASYKFFAPELDPALIKYELLQQGLKTDGPVLAKEDFIKDPDFAKLKDRLAPFVAALPTHAEQAYLDQRIMAAVTAGKELATPDKEFLDGLILFLTGDRQPGDREKLQTLIDEVRANKSVNKKLLRLAEAALKDSSLTVVLPPKPERPFPFEETELPSDLAPTPAELKPAQEIAPAETTPTDAETEAEIENELLAALPGKDEKEKRLFFDKIISGGLDLFVKHLIGGLEPQEAADQVSQTLYSNPVPEFFPTVEELDANREALTKLLSTYPKLKDTGLTFDHLVGWAEFGGKGVAPAETQTEAKPEAEAEKSSPATEVVYDMTDDQVESIGDAKPTTTAVTSPPPPPPPPPKKLDRGMPESIAGEVTSGLIDLKNLKPAEEINPNEPTIIVDEADIVEPEISEPPTEALPLGSKEYKNFVSTAHVATLKKRRSINDPEYQTPNEDVFFAKPDLGVYAVFDGSGDQGGLAALAAKEILDVFSHSYLKPNSNIFEKKAGLVKMVSMMNDQVSNLAKSKNELNRIATSLEIVVVHEEENGDLTVLSGNIGTSRAYLKRPKQELTLISTDDSSRSKRLRELIATKMEGLTPESEGRITQVWENARTSADFKTLNPTEASVAQMLWESYRGPEKTLKIKQKNQDEPSLNIATYRIEKGINKILLTTEGLNTQITQDELESVVATLNDSKELAEHVVAAADDVTQQRKENYRTVHKKIGNHVSVGDDLTALSIVIEAKK